MNRNQFNEKFSIWDVLKIFQNRYDPEGKVKFILIAVGIVLTPITLAGALWFFIRSFHRHLEPEGVMPTLSPMPIITKISMVIGGASIWFLLFAAYRIFSYAFPQNDISMGYIILYLIVMSLVSAIMMNRFDIWRNGVFINMEKSTTHGSARFADHEEYQEFYGKDKGIYIGNNFYNFDKQGHILTCAGPRSGKFVNLIAHNLLGISQYIGSWFVIDVKGEISAVTARFQRSLGRKVIVLNPWNLLNPSEDTYNPLDLIDPTNEESLIDDASIIAQMIVPDKPGDKDPFWSNRARSLITGMIVHLMLLENEEGKEEVEKTLTTIWKWLRLSADDFLALGVDMVFSTNEAVNAVGNEIKAAKDNEKMFGSILATAQDATDFLKSPSLQRSLKSSSFDINQLSNGNITLYVVIPADKLDTQSQWLRLVTTTSLLAVVRNKNKKVTFVLDEFAALGKMPIIETYMGLSSGYNITLWPIVQSLIQLRNIYGHGWESFTANAAVRHYFGVNDNFTADYISKSFGITTFQSQHYNPDKARERTARALVTPDEVKWMSAKSIFMQIDQRNPTYFPKYPYYADSRLVGTYDANPYYSRDEAPKA